MRYNELLNTLQNLMPDKRKKDFADMLKLSRQNLSNKLTDNAIVSAKIIKLLKDEYNIELNTVDSYVTIEHIGIKAECGNGLTVYDEPEITPIRISSDTITKYMRCSHPYNLKAFTARGDSMRPLIEDGDTVLVDIGRTDIVNQGVFVFKKDNDWRIKRLNLRLDNTLEVISDNKQYEKEVIKPDTLSEITIIGKVILNLSRSL